jgi:hypothetical protein
MHVWSSFVARKVALWLAVFSVLQLACAGFSAVSVKVEPGVARQIGRQEAHPP